jgi:hypothetical protein
MVFFKLNKNARALWLMTTFGAAIVSWTSCDPEGRQECQWTLEPEPKLKGTTAENMIPLCARNRVTNKEDCRFQASLDFAKGAWTKKFRYVDITSDASKAPKVIKSIKYCD